MANRYYLSHQVSSPSELNDIIEKGYLKNKELGLFSRQTMPSFFRRVTLFFDFRPLYKNKFILMTGLFRTMVDPRVIDVYSYLELIGSNLTTNRVILKHKINLKKYLVAICCETLIPEKLIWKINKLYPKVRILMREPENANDIYFNSY